MKKYFLLVSALLMAPFAEAQKSPLEPQPRQEEEFQYPLFFNVIDKELKIDSPRFVYDLQSSKGASLDLGNGIVFNNDSFLAAITNDELHLSWNSHLVPTGEISIITTFGEEIYKKKIDTIGSWVLKDLRGPEAPQWKNDEKFRFCIRQELEKGFSNLCSQSYAIIVKPTNIQLGKTRSSASPQIIYQNEERPHKGSELLALDAPIQFFATINTNASYEFLSEPLKPKISDMVADEEGHITLTGEFPKPLKDDVVLIKGEDYGSFVRKIGFEKTIAERPDLWLLKLPREHNMISLPGKSGGVFLYQLTINNAPTEKDRLFVKAPSYGTYLSQDQFVFKDKKGDIKTWAYEAQEQFAVNKINVNPSGHEQSPHSYLNVYRGSSGEASVRLTGIGTTDGSFVLLGEGHVAWWFNDLFGWQNDYLSKQRWGASARFFSSVMDFPVKTSGGGREDVSLQVTQLDLRYRLNQGLWEREETIGLIGAYEAISVDTENIGKLGVGIFWARSMPRSIDAWFSKIPYMNYPKWVDMELITYLTSPDSDVRLKNDFLLNFHGKVLWTPRYFGEAGFGVKNYHHERHSDGSGAIITTFYGTLGIGINF